MMVKIDVTRKSNGNMVQEGKSMKKIQKGFNKK